MRVSQEKKQEVYGKLQQDMALVMDNETNLIARMANLSAMLKKSFDFSWVGFYLIDEIQRNNLVLGPFQGEIAPFRVVYNQGIMGRSWGMAKTLVVPNVHEFEDSIYVPEGANSQIIMPICNPDSRIVGILNINSNILDYFEETDKFHLEKIVELLIK